MSGTRKALIALLVLALLLAGGLLGVFLFVRHSIDSQIQHVQTSLGSETSTIQSLPQSAEKGKDITFLVMGSDSRQSGGDPTDWTAGAQRSDVLMLVQITGDRKGLNIMSIPRDSWGSIPGHGTAKINAAFSYGGADLAIETVQNLTGITIDHFMITDFTSFSELTDALGGVTIATEMKDLRATGVNFFTAPYTGTGTSDDGQSIVNLNLDAVKAIGEAWNNDTVDQYLNTHQSMDILGDKPAA
ncbi:LCP family protein [Actinomyces culturomici]|uniref:LCP family protein n=1 Tax=Actinomyces culturomici TaxID=1926276 RepID=UPI000E1FC564|nr:LCP family protein [Actinomyces culturomici]